MSTAGKWIILLIAFDDCEIEPHVIKERIGADENEELAALCRGGELIAVLDDEEEIAEAYRLEFEKQCLR